MSIQYPERLATKQDLSDMYQKILPYLGGSADAGFTPVGTLIAVMGVTAPANYLACDGTVYNIADYPELATYFYQQFGSKNKFGGNGTTTFAVPDLRGEFLRGTGANSHASCGNGSAVGTHQNPTQHNLLWSLGNNTTPTTSNCGVYTRITADGGRTEGGNKDSNIEVESTPLNLKMTPSAVSEAGGKQTQFTSRPTNTSVLFCIATKNIYLDPKNDYSTDEKVVGTWIDGKTLYQRTLLIKTPTEVTTDTPKAGEKVLISNDADMTSILCVSGYITSSNGGTLTLPVTVTNDLHYVKLHFDQSTHSAYIFTNSSAYQNLTGYATVQYTKTT